ncbi:MAG: hypothetical protein ABSE20_30875, partial [Acetobacteraceae bacterium]
MDIELETGFEHLLTFAVTDMAKAVSVRRGETEARQFARCQAAVHMIMGFQPRDVIEVLLAGHCVMVHEVMTADVHDSLRGEAPSNRRTLVALNKAFNDNLDRLERYRQRPAEGQRAAPEAPTLGASADVISALGERGALFLTDLCSVTGRMPIEVADALWDGIARGLVTADGFQAVRSLLGGRARLGHLVRDPASSSTLPAGRSRQGLPRPGRPRPRVRPALTGGRWTLLGGGLGGQDDAAETVLAGSAAEGYDADELAEAMAGQLLHRWGVVFRDLVVRELIGIGWRDVLWALRRLEARGVVRGGRFVSGFTGEQFALPEAYDQLRSVAGRAAEGH